jgi:hypothetical protein
LTSAGHSTARRRSHSSNTEPEDELPGAFWRIHSAPSAAHSEAIGAVGIVVAWSHDEATRNVCMGRPTTEMRYESPHENLPKDRSHETFVDVVA